MLKQASSTKAPNLMAGAPQVDAEDPVGSRDNLIALIGEILEEDVDPRCQMVSVENPAQFLAEQEGRALFQLRSATIRFPVRTFVTLNRWRARGATRAQIIDAIDAATRWQPGEWRVVAATHSETFRTFWTRQPSGLSESDRAALFARPPEREDVNIQLTKPVAAKDPVMLVHLALAEVSRQDPAQGQRNQKLSAWDTFVRTNGMLKHMPMQGRRTRAEAIRIICDHYEYNPEDVSADLSLEQVERVHEFRGYGLSDEEIAGALRVLESQVSKVERLDA